MFAIVSALLRYLFSWLRGKQELALENLALRHQIAVLNRPAPKPRLQGKDRLFWPVSVEHFGEPIRSLRFRWLRRRLRSARSKLWDNFAEGCFNILSSARSAIDHRTFALECTLDIAAQSVLLACVISMQAQRLGWMQSKRCRREDAI